jgi:squalene-hopene/tetraprenyl-beta-curcumene cyclase
LGTWPRLDGEPNNPNGPSDGYATGLVAVALCSNGYGARTPQIARSIAWIMSNQRASGRWYTRSTYSDQLKGYITNLATAYAMMAIQTCQGSS